MGAKHFWTRWRVIQMVVPMAPIPFGAYCLYKAIKSFNRSPPPLASDTTKMLARPLYPEPVYQTISFAPSTFARNARSRADPAGR